MISAAREAASIDRASSACWRRSAKAALVPCFAIEASRLARNGRDWHTLIEFCGLVGTVIVDEDGIYDPRHPNDRLLLGMKGTMSELELSLFRQRSHAALKQKARRGELFLGVAAGYAKAGRDRIEKDPDQRVAGCAQTGFCQIRRAPKRATGSCLAARRGHCVAGRMPQRGGGAQHRLEAAALQHRAQHSDQPRLCWRLCLWADDEQGERRERPQAREAWIAAPHGGMGCAAQGSARGLHHLERIREEPACDCRQCDRQRRLRSEERCGAESCCWRVFCAVDIAVASCMWAMAARRGAITAKARS